MRPVLPFYRDRDSALHRLHPGAKVALALGVLVASLLLSHPVYLATIIAGTVVLAAAAHVLREWWAFVRLFSVVAVTVVAINAVASLGGSTVLLEGPTLPVFGRLAITWEGIAFGIAMAMRLLATVSAFTVLSLTLHPDELTRLLSRVAYRSGLVLSLSTRLYPVVMRDAATIVDAQRSRGLDLDSGGRIARARKRLPVVVPLFHSSLERAVGIAEAMEARGFGSGARTRWRPRRWRLIDWAIVAFPVLLCYTATLLRFMDGDPSYYPTVQLGLDQFTVIFSLALLALVAGPAVLRRDQLGGDGPGR